VNRSSDPSLKGLGLLAIAGIVGFVLVAITVGVPFAVPVGIVGAAAAAIILRGPLGQAIARRLEGGQPPAGDEVYAELDDLRHRMVELEERLDFTERLLTQSRDRERVTPQLDESSLDEP
jgi:hypothetical protein